jgi:hypothetical protein
MRTAPISTGGFKGPDDALETVRVRVEQARVHGAELICLPQLGFLPYFPAWLAALKVLFDFLRIRLQTEG